MLMPHSMDNLMNAGVLNFDAVNFLNSNNSIPANTRLCGGNPYLVNNGLNQPAQDGFVSKLTKPAVTNTIKKVATAAIAVGLALCGFSKVKNLCSNIVAKFK